jgi:pseudouridine synthase
MRERGFEYDRRASARLAARLRARPDVAHAWMFRHLVVYRRAHARRLPSLQKWLQAAGIGKREAKAEIRAGRVAVDGDVQTRFAAPVPQGARVTVDGAPIEPAAPVWYLLHKPRKHLSTLEPGREDGLARYLPQDAPRVFLVGRLDYGSEGAILLTNDGTLARRVLDPLRAVPRVYRVKVRDRLEPDHPKIVSMARPIRIGRRVVCARSVAFEALRTRATWIRVVLVDGAHHEVRALCRRARLQIVKLRREAIGPVQLGDLRPRCVRPLREDELRAMRDCTDGNEARTSVDCS